MLKYIALIKRKEGATLETFRTHTLKEHTPIARRLPGMRQYSISVVAEETSGSPYDAIE